MKKIVLCWYLEFPRKLVVYSLIFISLLVEVFTGQGLMDFSFILRFYHVKSFGVCWFFPYLFYAFYYLHIIYFLLIKKSLYIWIGIENVLAKDIWTMKLIQFIYEWIHIIEYNIVHLKYQLINWVLVGFFYLDKSY